MNFEQVYLLLSSKPEDLDAMNLVDIKLFIQDLQAKIAKYELLIEEKDNKIWKLEGGQNAEY